MKLLSLVETVVLRRVGAKRRALGAKIMEEREQAAKVLTWPAQVYVGDGFTGIAPASHARDAHPSLARHETRVTR